MGTVSARVLCSHRTRTYRPDIEQPSDGSTFHHRRSGRITKFKTKKRLPRRDLRRQNEPEPRQRYFRRSHAADELAQAPGEQGRTLRQVAR